MGMNNALEAALDNVAQDGGTWTDGRDEFWRQLQERDATVWEAFNAAMIVANGGRPLPPPWYKATRGKFYRLHKESTRQNEPEQDEPEQEQSNPD